MFVGYLRTLIYFYLYKELLEKDKSITFTSFYVPFYWLYETYILGGVFAILIAVRCLNFMHIKMMYSILGKAVRLGANFLITLVLLFLLFELLFHLLAVVWNYLLFYKYIFPAYKNYYAFKDKNNFHHREYFPLILSYLSVPLSIFGAAIFIRMYKKSVKIFQDERISKKRRMRRITLKVLTSEPYYRRKTFRM